MRLACMSLALAASLTTIAPARAQSELEDAWSGADLGSARQLFAQAQSAEAEGRWAEARAKLDTVAAIKRTAVVLYHLGVCEQQLGRPRDALNRFEQSLALARTQPHAQVLRLAAAKIATTMQRVPRAALDIEPPLPGTMVLLDGKPLAEGAREVRLNPDQPSTLEVRAPGRKPFIRVILLPEAAYERVRVDLQPDEGPARRSAAATGSPPVGTWIAGATALGLGASGLTTFLVSTALEARGSAPCDPERYVCRSAEAAEDLREAGRLRSVSLGLGIATAAAMGVGVTLWVIDSRKRGLDSTEPSTPLRSIVLEVRPHGAALVGRF
ncbi:MAG: tetratricopeptide repeat protein [Polyangiaceae bacterium]